MVHKTSEYQAPCILYLRLGSSNIGYYVLNTESAASCLPKRAAAGRRPIRQQLVASLGAQLSVTQCVMNHRICLCLLKHFSIKYSVLCRKPRVWRAIEQHVCLVQICSKRDSAGKLRTKFQWMFSEEAAPSNQNVHYLLNKLKTSGALLDAKTENQMC